MKSSCLPSHTKTQISPLTLGKGMESQAGGWEGEGGSPWTVCVVPGLLKRCEMGLSKSQPNLKL